MLLELVTDIDSPSGYSSFARGFGEALYKAGVDLKITPSKHDKTTIPLNDFWADHIREFSTRGDRPDARMHIETPEFFKMVKGMKNMGFVFWETDRIPGANRPGEAQYPPHFNWVSQMNLMDEMWTSAYSAGKAFADSGYKGTLRIIGVPMEFLNTNEELPINGVTVDEGGHAIPREHRPIVIGTVAQYNFRKNLEDLIVSVCSEFREKEAVLLMKTYGNSQNDPGQEEAVRRRVMGLKNAIGWKDIPKIVLLQNTLSDLDMRKLYNSMDMFVTCTRGEGFCIPAAQAMGSGIPTLCTGWSAMMDFVKEGETGWPVDYQMEPVYGMPFIPWYRPDQRWARINMVDLMKKMREVADGLEDPNSDVNRIAADGAKRIREQYNPDVIGKLGRELLEEALGS